MQYQNLCVLFSFAIRRDQGIPYDKCIQCVATNTELSCMGGLSAANNTIIIKICFLNNIIISVSLQN